MDREILGMLVFWVLVIVAIVWVLRDLGGGRSEQDRESPMNVFQRRLAEGDISVEEYERRRQALESSGGT